MPPGSTVSKLLVEIDGDDAKLREVLNAAGAKVRKFGTETAGAGDVIGNKFGGAARQIAGATEQIARSGQVAGDAAKQIIAQGSEIALMFGTAGPIVGAIGIAGLAIFEMFDRSRKEMEKTRAKAISEVNAIRRSTDLGSVSSTASALFSGDPFFESDDKVEQAARRRGLRALTAERDAANARIQSIDRSGASATRESRLELEKLQKKLDEVSPLIARIENQYRAAITQQGILAKKAAETTDFQIRQAREEDGQRASKKAAEEAAKKAKQALIDGLRDTQAAADEALVQQGAALTDRLRAQLVRGTKSAVDDAVLALQQFDREITDAAVHGVPVDEQLVQQVRALLAAQVQNAEEAERLGKEYAGVGDEAERVGKQVAKWSEDLAKVDLRAGGLAHNIGAAASVAAGLATAFAGANSEITRTLAGVASVAEGIGDILDKAGAAGGLGKLLGSAGGLASIAGPLGAIVAGGGAVVSALSGLGRREPTEAEREALRAQEANTAALRELTTHLGDLALTATGQARTQAAGIAADVLRRAAATREARLAAAQESGGQGFDPNAVNLFVDIPRETEAALRLAGISFEDFRDAAKRLGIEVTDLAHLTEAQLFAVEQAAGSLSTQFSDLEERLDVLGATAAERLTATLDLFAKVADSTTQHTGEIAREVRDNFNLGTQAGRDAAVAYVRARFEEGAITADVAKQIIGALQGVQDAAGQAADALDVFAGSLSDIALLADLTERSTETIFQAIDAAVQAFPEFADAITGLVAGVDLNTPEGQATFRANVRRLAEQFARNGLTPGERGVLQFLQGLVHSLPELTGATTDATGGVTTLTGSVQDFADTVQSVVGQFRAAASQIEQDAPLLGLTPQQVRQQQFDEFKKKFPGLFIDTGVGLSNLAELDAGVARARQTLASQPSGSESHDAAAEFLKLVLPALQTAAASGRPSFTPPGVTEQIASSAKALRDETGVTLAGIGQSVLVLQREHLPRISAATEAILGALAAPRLLEPPALPSFGRGGGGGAVVDARATINVNINNLVVPDGADSDAVAARIGRGVRTELEGLDLAQLLGDGWATRQLVTGDLTVRGR